MLYREPEVKFGGDKVGGIRISHASHIDGPFEIALTETRGKRKPFRVEPLPAEQTHSTIDPDKLAEFAQYGTEKAKEGSESLRTWWSSITKEMRQALAGKLDGWKAMAAESDAKGGQA
ncbi:hypothetical protein Ga0100231_005080 [Opitutaceae bacterium TAV4]|nr:hypothetical protein Ga0100231_005080 [Opitutaceae bacterium TAV4]